MLENIIEKCKYVSKNSKYVSINEEKLNQFIEKIENIKMEHWLSSSPFELLELPVETIINFLLINYKLILSLKISLVNYFDNVFGY